MRRLPLLLALVTSVAAVACGSETPTADFTLPPTETNVAGRFVLSSANGQLIPYQVSFTSLEVRTLVSDKIVLSATNTWADTTTYSVLNRMDGTTSTLGTATAGTYSIANGQINFVMTTGGAITFAGSVVGNALSVNYLGARYIYNR